MAFYPVSNCRALDTRSATPLLGGTPRDLAVLNSGCGIPATATAYWLNVTAIPQTGLGYLTTWPSGQAQPLVSTLNSFTGAVTANAAIVPAGANGNISFYVTDTSDLVVDVYGYFAPWAATTGPPPLTYFYLPAYRALDTRSNGGPIDGSRTIDLTVASILTLGSYPGAQAFTMNVAAVPVDPLGFLSVLPAGGTPTTSTLNAWDKAVTSNLATAAGTTASVTVFTPAQSQVILDVTGVFVP